MLSRHMKIDSADLRWYAAFHNEGHHPHVHLMVYSAKDNDGFQPFYIRFQIAIYLFSSGIFETSRKLLQFLPNDWIFTYALQHAVREQAHPLRCFFFQTAPCQILSFVYLGKVLTEDIMGQFRAHGFGR